MECVVWLLARYITLAGSQQCGVCCLVVCEIHHLGGQPTVWSVLFGVNDMLICCTPHLFTSETWCTKMEQGYTAIPAVVPTERPEAVKE